MAMNIVSLSTRWSGTLAESLTMEMSIYLRDYDLPVPGAQLTHLGVMARAFIGTVINQSVRPWGLVTDLAAALGTSRETLYTIAARVREGVLIRPNGRRRAPAP